jgi:hypothetical protein
VLRRLRPKLTYANVISSICLFLLLAGGGAYAAAKLKANSVGTKQIKNNAVNGSKVADGSLNASDIGGAVNDAKHASNSDQLGGAPPSAYLSSSNAQRIDFAATGCAGGEPQCEADLVAMDGLVIHVSCAGASGGDLQFKVTSAPAGVTLAMEGEKSNPGGGSFVTNAPGLLNQIVLQLTSLGGTQVGGGTLILRSATHTKTVVFSAKETDNAGLANCQVFGNSVQT